MSLNIIILKQKKIKIVGSEGKIMPQEADEGKSVAMISTDFRLVFSPCLKYFLVNLEVLDFLNESSLIFEG